jgi:hypothetical protein
MLAAVSTPARPMDGAFCTPERALAASARRSRRLAAKPVAAGPHVVEASESDASDAEQTPPQPSPSPSPSSAGNSTGRKRKSIGTSTVKALAGCNLSTTKKRARMSIGTPGKATPLDAEREKDVAKRFVELEVTEAYRAIRKQTGALGGNAAGGAIYGEITQASFQRIVDFMKDQCELSAASLFLDVGSGLGKPNFHVAIDPGVEVSYGVELEDLRWHLSLHNLKSVLALDSNKSKPNRTIFTAGDITDARTLNPFSHIYSFDVGFPPDVMDQLATIFNRSEARYFASFHPPRKVIEMYGFDVDNIGRVATSMAGSNEGHQCYFYRRTSDDEPVPSDKPEDAAKTSAGDAGTPKKLHIDPLFRKGFEVLSRGRDGVRDWIVDFFGEEVYAGRTRRQKAQSLKLQRQKQERPMESYYRVVGKARAIAMEPPVKKRRQNL